MKSLRPRQIAFFMMRCTAIPWWFRFKSQRRGVTFLTYHELSPEIGSSQLRALKRCYNFISLREYLEARRRGSLEGLPSRAAVVTFDDGFRGNHELLPLFRDLDIPVTIFLVSGVVGTQRRLWFTHDLPVDEKATFKLLPNRERLARLDELGHTPVQEYSAVQTLTAHEIAEMQDSVDFQAHTMFHPILPNCADEECWEEISGCKEQLEKTFGLSIYAFAYPNGDFGAREEEYARRAGYACAVTTDPGVADENTDLFRIPRMVINGQGSASEAIVQASGVWSWIRPHLVRGLRSVPLGERVFRIAARTGPRSVEDRGPSSDRSPNR